MTWKRQKIYAEEKKIYAKISAWIRMQFSRLFVVLMTLLIGKDRYSFPTETGRKEEDKTKAFISWKCLRFQHSFLLPNGMTRTHVHIYKEKAIKKTLDKRQEASKSCWQWHPSGCAVTGAIILIIWLPVINSSSETLLFHVNSLSFVFVWHSTALVPELSCSKRYK